MFHFIFFMPNDDPFIGFIVVVCLSYNFFPSFRLRNKLKLLADQYALSEQHFSQKVSSTSKNFSLFIYLELFLTLRHTALASSIELCTVAAEGIRTSACWSQTSATGREVCQGTNTDAIICGTGFTTFDSREKFKITTSSWWREVSAVPGFWICLILHILLKQFLDVIQIHPFSNDHKVKPRVDLAKVKPSFKGHEEHFIFE